MKSIDISGQMFGRLVVVGRTLAYVHGSPLWRCQCACGATTDLRAGTLRSGNTRSCGCLHSESAAAAGAATVKHGHAKPGRETPTYRSWRAMKTRCLNENHKVYERYGACGVKICERWLTFEHFLSDMGERSDGMTLDRYPNQQGNYEPGNCRWATRSQQNRNRRPWRRSKDEAA